MVALAQTRTDWLPRAGRITTGAIVAGVGYALASAIAGALAAGIGLPLPPVAEGQDPASGLATSVALGASAALVLAPLAARLRLPVIDRAGVVFVALYVLNGVVNAVEGAFFTTLLGDGLGTVLLISAASSAAVAAAVAWLIPPAVVDDRLGAALRDLLSRRSAASWTWRIGLAGLLYLPTYFLFGSLTLPFVRAYYEDPSLGLGLRVPPVWVIPPLEVGRGLLYVVALLPLVALLPGPRMRLALSLGVLVAALNAWQPLLLALSWPVEMRLVHALEITGTALVQGMTIAWLLGSWAAGPRAHRLAAVGADAGSPPGPPAVAAPAI